MISTFILKLIAMISMTLDHVAVAFSLNEVFRFIGRLAFPLYALMLAETLAYFKTQEKERQNRYLLSLLVLAVLSEAAYDYALLDGGFWDNSGANQVLQFFLYACFSLKAGKLSPVQKYAALILAVCLCSYFHIGYYGAGMLYLFLLERYVSVREGMTKEQRLKESFVLTVSFLLMMSVEEFILYLPYLKYHGLYRYSGIVLKSYFADFVNSGIFLSIPLIALKDPTHKKGSPLFQSIYHYYYPLHLWILTILRYSLH